MKFGVMKSETEKKRSFKNLLNDVRVGCFPYSGERYSYGSVHGS